jgi:hypothetical protein
MSSASSSTAPTLVFGSLISLVHEYLLIYVSYILLWPGIGSILAFLNFKI